MLSLLGSNNLDNYVNETGVIKEVASMIKSINADERKIAQARYAEDLERLWNTERDLAVMEGIAKGKEEGKKEIILQMYLNKIDISTIAKITGYFIEEIENIINN